MHGTIFAVTQDADTFVVEVAEGRVSVTDRSGEHIVTTGQRLLSSPVGVAEGDLAPDPARTRSAPLVGAPEVVDLEKLQPGSGRRAPASSAAPAAAALRGVAPVTRVTTGSRDRADNGRGRAPGRQTGTRGAVCGGARAGRTGGAS